MFGLTATFCCSGVSLLCFVLAVKVETENKNSNRVVDILVGNRVVMHSQEKGNSLSTSQILNRVSNRR